MMNYRLRIYPFSYAMNNQRYLRLDSLSDVLHLPFCAYTASPFAASLQELFAEGLRVRR